MCLYSYFGGKAVGRMGSIRSGSQAPTFHFVDLCNFLKKLLRYLIWDEKRFRESYNLKRTH